MVELNEKQIKYLVYCIATSFGGTRNQRMKAEGLMLETLERLVDES